MQSNTTTRTVKSDIAILDEKRVLEVSKLWSRTKSNISDSQSFIRIDFVVPEVVELSVLECEVLRFVESNFLQTFRGCVVNSFSIEDGSNQHRTMDVSLLAKEVKTDERI